MKDVLGRGRSLPSNTKESNESIDPIAGPMRKLMPPIEHDSRTSGIQCTYYMTSYILPEQENKNKSFPYLYCTPLTADLQDAVCRSRNGFLSSLPRSHPSSPIEGTGQAGTKATPSNRVTGTPQRKCCCLTLLRERERERRGEE